MDTSTEHSWYAGILLKAGIKESKEESKFKGHQSQNRHTGKEKGNGGVRNREWRAERSDTS